MTSLTHRLNDIDSDGIEIHEQLPAARIEEALSAVEVDGGGSKIAVDAHLSKQNTTVLCAGRVRGDLSLRCHRCLEPARVDVDLPLHTVFTPAPADVDVTDANDDAEDVDYAHHDNENVDVWPVVREQLILAVPMTVLCKEDCLGLCPLCGIDRNVSSCDCQPAPKLTPFSALRSVKL